MVRKDGGWSKNGAVKSYNLFEYDVANLGQLRAYFSTENHSEGRQRTMREAKIRDIGCLRLCMLSSTYLPHGDADPDCRQPVQ